MEPNNAGNLSPQYLSQQSLPLFSEGINLVLSLWTALQMAVQNEWGGRNSRERLEQLAADIFSWFSQASASFYIDDLESVLDEAMLLSFNTGIEDGSIEEVAEQLMTMHEEFLHGNYQSVERLRCEANSRVNSVSQSRQVVNENEAESSGTEEEASDMVVETDAPNTQVEAEEGWSVVSSRRKRRS
ncbi:hypothetical protein GIB67_032825 [Kingdonia uniflora]|uniref:Pre-rRNA-processing protein TSR2 n=1 Tax=Kingdonia uniflora TaxID=39325 RepID=A0A7J7NBS5_9MAGN|nr:hypothetical protein GIB67_032825 [Kingdonia uniflora]